MVRVKGGTASRERHKKVRRATKGYRNRNHTTFHFGKEAALHAGKYAYIGRKQKKRDYRKLWIARISAALRKMDERYSEVKNQWLHARMEIDRKNLSELAVSYPKVFEKIVEVARKAKKVA